MCCIGESKLSDVTSRLGRAAVELPFELKALEICFDKVRVSCVECRYRQEFFGIDMCQVLPHLTVLPYLSVWPIMPHVQVLRRLPPS